MTPNAFKVRWTVLTLAIVSASLSAAAEPQPLEHAHAHNDYLHERPLLDALDHGFCSIEADIWRVGEKILVAHTAAELHPDRTLESLYLKPLADRCAAREGWVYEPGRTITLLIDLKSDGVLTYAALKPLLAKYRQLFEPLAVDGERPAAPVQAVLSGNRPIDVVAADMERLCGIDGRLPDLDSDQKDDMFPLVSDNWTGQFQWRGEGPMLAEERARLRSFATKAHGKGMRLRFWAAPDEEAVWAELADAGVDLLGADDLPRLQRFLEARQAAAKPTP